MKLELGLVVPTMMRSASAQRGGLDLAAVDEGAVSGAQIGENQAPDSSGGFPCTRETLMSGMTCGLRLTPDGFRPGRKREGASLVMS